MVSGTWVKFLLIAAVFLSFGKMHEMGSSVSAAEILSESFPEKNSQTESSETETSPSVPWNTPAIPILRVPSTQSLWLISGAFRKTSYLFFPSGKGPPRLL